MWIFVWFLFVAFVVFRAAMYFRRRRYGWGIALLFLALFVGYEATMQWRESRSATPGIAPASPPVETIEEPSAEPYRDEAEPRGPVQMGPLPEASSD